MRARRDRGVEESSAIEVSSAPEIGQDLPTRAAGAGAARHPRFRGVYAATPSVASRSQVVWRRTPSVVATGHDARPTEMLRIASRRRLRSADCSTAAWIV